MLLIAETFPKMNLINIIGQKAFDRECSNYTFTIVYKCLLLLSYFVIFVLVISILQMPMVYIVYVHVRIHLKTIGDT